MVATIKNVIPWLRMAVIAAGQDPWERA